ncbi:LysR family transcriptional regulator [Sediminivirga luteola]|uniref:LysR family transcriptional regulator n=1 Tax=Sediminivirga luteola TaxID=1774748 RepID=UPI001F5AC279|nr:LysR family transcriptional regulator [Sediminivirga luteola]MCI2266409.1 LysR family transcriptional regulator [Sediminivirga luteola]
MDQWVDRLAPQLAALVALAEHDGHMTRAAAALGVPQSSMSRRVHALEAELGVPLLLRAGRGVRLSPGGAELARRARDPLRQIGSAAAALAGDADPDHGVVTFGFPLTLGSGLVPELLAAFRHRHPGIRVQLTQAHGAQLEADLLSGALDLAITIPAPAKARHTIIGTQHIQAVLPESHPRAAARRLRLQDLASETFIANPPSYNLRRLTEAWCAQAGFTPDIGFEVTEFATIRELISRGLGVALLPGDERTPPGIVERPLTGARYERDIALCWATATEAPVTRRLSEFLASGFAREEGQ